MDFLPLHYNEATIKTETVLIFVSKLTNSAEDNYFPRWTHSIFAEKPYKMFLSEGCSVPESCSAGLLGDL